MGVLIRIVWLLTLSLPLPGDDAHTVDVGFPSQVDHPDGFLHVEVVKDGAAVEALVVVAIHCSGRVSVHPLIANVALVVSPVVDPRFLLER